MANSETRVATDCTGPVPTSTRLLSLFATCIWSAGILLVFLASQAAVFFGTGAHQNGAPDAALAPSMVALMICLSAPTAAVATILVARFQDGRNALRFLALNSVSARSLWPWLVAAIGFPAGYDLAAWLLSRPLVPPFLAETYRMASSKPLLMLAFVIAAPAFEELFFRGFLYRRLELSRLGGLGALAVTSIAFTAMHTTAYNGLDIVAVLCLGVLLGLARRTTNSTLTSFAMHALVNGLSTLQAALLA